MSGPRTVSEWLKAAFAGSGPIHDASSRHRTVSTMLVLVRGVAGTGKSTVRNELLARGQRAYGIDEDGYACYVNRSSGAPLDEQERYADGAQRTEEFNANNVWAMVTDRVEQLAQSCRGDVGFLCGVAQNDQEVWALFDVVVCLYLDATTLRYRLANRTGNDFGKSEHELAAVLRWNLVDAREHRELGCVMVNAAAAVEVVVDQVMAAAEKGLT
jgi:broad-specificity NMP kinase